MKTVAVLGPRRIRMQCPLREGPVDKFHEKFPSGCLHDFRIYCCKFYKECGQAPVGRALAVSSSGICAHVLFSQEVGKFKEECREKVGHGRKAHYRIWYYKVVEAVYGRIYNLSPRAARKMNTKRIRTKGTISDKHKRIRTKGTSGFSSAGG